MPDTAREIETCDPRSSLPAFGGFVLNQFFLLLEPRLKGAQQYRLSTKGTLTFRSCWRANLLPAPQTSKPPEKADSVGLRVWSEL